MAQDAPESCEATLTVMSLVEIVLVHVGVIIRVCHCRTRYIKIELSVTTTVYSVPTRHNRVVVVLITHEEGDIDDC